MAKLNKKQIVEKLNEFEKEQIQLNISTQAANIIEKIDDFDMNDFTKWYTANKLTIGGLHILEYLSKGD